MSVGGSLRQVSIDGRPFAVAADGDAERNLGGFTSDTEMNGDGSGREIMQRSPWQMGGIVLSIDDVISDLEYLQESVDIPGYRTCLFTFASGISYEGQGKIAGDFTASTMSTTAAVSFKGPGKLTRQ